MFAKTLILALAIASFTYYQSIAGEGRFTNRLTLIRKTNAINEQLATIPHRNFLLIIDRPGQYTVNNMGAVSFEYAKRHNKSIFSDLQRHLYRDVYVALDASYNPPNDAFENLKKDLAWPDEIGYEPVMKQQNKANEYVLLLRFFAKN